MALFKRRFQHMSARPRRLASPGLFDNADGTDVASYISVVRQDQIEPRASEPAERIARIRIDQIDRSPYQVRVDFDPAVIDALADDIKANGLSHPVTLRNKPDGRYELVAGERRWRAAQAARLATIEARVRELDDFDAHLVGVSENNQRANLSPWEKAHETMELQKHARSMDKPHAQRNLARYLNRSVTVVNQQLAIADAVTAELLTAANVTTHDMCQLAHETLHRIAKVPPVRRIGALEDAVRGHDRRKVVADSEQPAKDASVAPADIPDTWTQLWERGGFQVHIRKPLRDIEPDKAHKYIEDLLPGIGGLAARASETSGRAVVHWAHEHGQLVFLRPQPLTRESRAEARDVLTRMIAELDAWK
jgi:ParB/RepB/Spo0J family partition protein